MSTTDSQATKRLIVALAIAALAGLVVASVIVMAFPNSRNPLVNGAIAGVVSSTCAGWYWRHSGRRDDR